jgi:hypothetical protein
MTDVFRQEYKQLDQLTKDTIIILKRKAEDLYREIEYIEIDAGLTVDKRCMALAKTNLEQAVMWAVKAII